MNIIKIISKQYNFTATEILYQQDTKSTATFTATEILYHFAGQNGITT